jgi:prepilin-type processing-associated H-X9-DG protein/prepilin-type N-terminal cleavage/methylation domain-containing protein
MIVGGMEPVLGVRSRGFTLVELLIVIGLIAILIAMLLPAVGSARRRAGSVACLSNLRQWAVAANQYTGDYHNFLPRRGQGQQPTTVINRPSDWFNALPVMMRLTDYMDLVTQGQMPTAENRSLWICPQAADLPNSSGYLFTYGMNMRLSTWETDLPDRIDLIGSPSTMVFMADAPGGYCSILPFNAPFSPVARHSGRVNIVFLDGHAESLPGNYVGCGIGDPQLANVRWLVPGSTWIGPVE